MSVQNIVLCGGAKHRGKPYANAKVINLDTSSADANVHLKIPDITRRMASNLPPLLIDLLEVAAYVYCADQMVERGGKKAVDFGERWRRDFHFHVPVRELAIWSSPKVMGKLTETLGFLSDDYYSFSFVQSKSQAPMEQYFEFCNDASAGFIPDDVALFSGGLDSLAGLVRECFIDNKRIAAVSHRSSPKVDSLQRTLLDEMKKDRKSKNLFHIPIWVNTSGKEPKEYTQRTRSFLYATLATVIARLFGRDRILFYENGITSVNLPISEQLVGSLASRTTHPRTLNGFSDLFSALLGKPFAVENPFFWNTKADVVKSLNAHGYERLIRYSISCSHTRDQTKLHTHCGKCSQCIDRRFATLASGNEKNDPAEMYAVDLLTGARENTEDRTMLAAYINTAKEIEQMPEIEFFQGYSEIYRIFEYFPGRSSDEIAGKLFALYQRHAKQVGGVIEKSIEQKAGEIRQGVLPDSCAVMIAIPPRDKKPPPVFSHSPDYRRVNLRGETFSLTPIQASVVQALYENCANSGYEAGQAHLLEVVDSTSKRLRDLFRSSKRAFGKLIVNGSKRGTFRLNL